MQQQSLKLLDYRPEMWLSRFTASRACWRASFSKGRHDDERTTKSGAETLAGPACGGRHNVCRGHSKARRQIRTENPVEECSRVRRRTHRSSPTWILFCYSSGRVCSDHVWIVDRGPGVDGSAASSQRIGEEHADGSQHTDQSAILSRGTGAAARSSEHRLVLVSGTADSRVVGLHRLVRDQVSASVSMARTGTVGRRHRKYVLRDLEDERAGCALSAAHDRRTQG